jgi:manganese-dependent inorganic pyrophosphatase
MFKVGTSLEGKTVEEIVNTDIKEFESDGGMFAISQVFTLDIDSVFNKKDEYIEYINKLAADRKYKLVLLVITDIINNGSYLLYTNNDDEIISDAFGIRAFQGYFIQGIVSRKKQIVPKIMEVMR